MSRPLDDLLAKLDHVKPSGAGSTARCPAHDDRSNSLSISEGDDGRVLLHCHAGCEVRQIVAALGLTMGDLFPEPLPARSVPHGASDGPRRIVGTYGYQAEGGALLYQVLRFEPKDFRQRRPDGEGGWIWNLDGVPRVLYRLPGLLAADPAAPVFILEGEKDVNTLLALGLVATTNAGGAGKWRDEYNAHLAGRQVVILPDNDVAGEDHARHVADSLAGIATGVKILDLPGLPMKGDVSDWLDAGGTVDVLMALVETTAYCTASPEHEQTDDGEREDEQGAAVVAGPGRGRLSQATLLVHLMADCTLFHNLEGEAYAVLPVDGHEETHPLHSKVVRRYMQRRFYAEFGKTTGAQATQDALGTLAGKALFEGEERAVHLRIAEHDGAIYLDLCDHAWRVVEITGDGWRVIAARDCRLRFRRAKGMLPLPTPTTGGSLAALRPFVNVRDDVGWTLLVAYLVNCLRPCGPFWVLAVTGEQGSAKSTLLRLLRALTDPNVAPIRSFPRDERDLVIAASNGWLPCFDNASSIPIWMSDALCRLATGGGFATRTLYENDEETIFAATRPVALNGIEDVVTRGDLADRAIALALASIAEGDRKTETDLWQAFETKRPGLLGALLDAASGAIRNLPATRLDKLPRMADASLWIAAAEGALGWRPGTFMEAYTANRAEAGVLVLEDSPLAGAVLALMGQPSKSWTGSASELLALLNTGRDEAWRKQEGWPKRANGLAGMLRRLAPNLRAAGVAVTFERGGHARTRTILLEQVGETSSASSAGGGLTANCQENPADDSADDQLGSTSSAHGGSNSKQNGVASVPADDADDLLPPHSASTSRLVTKRDLSDMFPGRREAATDA